MRRFHLWALAGVFLLSTIGAAAAGPFGGGGPGLPGGGGGPGLPGGGAPPGFSHNGPDRDLRPPPPPTPKKAVRRLDRAAPNPNLGAVPTPPAPPLPPKP